MKGWMGHVTAVENPCTKIFLNLKIYYMPSLCLKPFYSVKQPPRSIHEPQRENGLPPSTLLAATMARKKGKELALFPTRNGSLQKS